MAATRHYVLDANALIALFEGRQPAAEKVRKMLVDASRTDAPLWMSAINWGEVFYTEWRRYGESKAREAEANLRRLPIVIIGVDLDRATRAAAIKQKHNLGYADAFAAELAIERGAWLVTADPEFSKTGKALSVYPLPRHERQS
ncbi:putative Ribonuclease VapC [Candidatus Sulfotelmatobacter kueseliae]|uniref:Ribonuclease VapC n=1 Tax=Candidatus Sulfotelmatobacter kueseliae TaxID=2042962 RepID=A0A2U3KJ67_9BACT|nr:putative Ribonuclease VapC [Candidatus Sulfotelmatobacter kueseliae]